MSAAKQIQEARDRHGGKDYFVLIIKAYCRNTRCVVREVDIKVKEYAGDRTSGSLTCPVCQKQLVLHEVLTLSEQCAHKEKLHRESDFD